MDSLLRLSLVVVIIMIYSSVTFAQGDSFMAPASTDDSFTEQFKNPPASNRILKINHGWSTDAAARKAFVDSILEGGFGGAVTNVNFGNGYVTNPGNWDALRGGIAVTHEAGLDLWMYDEAGYPSGRAGGLVLEGHPEREAHALLATSADVTVGEDGSFNIGPLAQITASSTDATGDIYAPQNANNGQTDTSDWRHWSNNPVNKPSQELPQWVILEWEHPWSVQKVVLWTMEGYEVQDYAIEYWDGADWRVFADAEIAGNTASCREHVALTPVHTSKLRFLGQRGPEKQPGIVRVVELEAIAAPEEGNEVATCSLTVPPGKLLLARALPVDNTNGILLDGALELPPATDGKITWKAPKGQWRLVAVSEDRLFDGSQVDFSGVPEHAPYVSLLDPDVGEEFIRITHEAYARELGSDLGKLFVSTFTDEPSLIADYYAREMPWSPIAWHPILATRYQERTGRDLMTEIPLLFLNGPEAAQTRYDFWQTVGDQLCENYFKRIQNWCKAHNIPSGGHLLLEEDIRHHIPLYGDFFACQRALDVPGIDVLNLNPTRTPWEAARLVSSAGELEGTTLVMSETSDFEEMFANPQKPVSLAQFRGTINRLLLGGINRFNTYSQLRDLTTDDLKALNDWTGRGSLALTGGIRNASIGVLYPVETAWTRFKPSQQGIRGAGELTDQLAQTIGQVNNLLYVNRREFSNLDSRTLIEARADSSELRFKNLAFQVIILPDTDILPAAAWQQLERFYQAGGVVIAAGSLPVNSETEFPSAAVQACGARIFGTPTNNDAPTWSQNSSGGIGVYLPTTCINELPAILDKIIGPDIILSDPAAPLRITRRIINNQDIYLIINDHAEPWQGTVTFGQPAPSAQQLELATGDIITLPDAVHVDLTLEGYGATIVRQSQVGRVPRLEPEGVY